MQSEGEKPVSFNRTFMELKSAGLGAAYAFRWSFNRTFMELKSETNRIAVAGGLVLIVPLWN